MKKTRQLLRFLYFLTALALIPQRSDATHISGADITYRWISGNSFEVTLTLYRDCSGIPAPINTTISYSSVSCNVSLTATLTQVPGTGQEITQPCSTSTTTCSGGTNTGIQQWQYRGIITLPARCNDWRFGYSICCRNCAITTLRFTNCNTVPGMYVEATLNNVAAPSNSSPTFTNIPVTFVCMGQPFVYNQGATDNNGDSIVYSFVTPRDHLGANVIYNTGFSPTSALSSSPPVAISGSTGTVTMTPTAQEVAVMAILVSEYRNGVLVGSVIRDMQIWTQACNNIIPSASGINGSNTYNIVACPGQPITFFVNSTDPNNSQNVNMFWNNGIAGATFNVSTGTRPTGTFTWTPTAAQARPQPYMFTVTVADNNCPIRGFQTFSYNITVPQLTATASATISACNTPGTGTASVVATGTGPFTYSWNPGGATTSSINNLVPGFYRVTVTDANGCTATATAAVNGPAPLAASASATANPSCAGQNNGSAMVSVSGGTQPYSYAWSPSGGTAASASNLSAGNYTVTIRDFRGCTQTASVSIVSPPPINATITPTNIACNGDANGSVSVNASGGTGPYAYEWNPGAHNTASVTGLSPGTYIVTITDFNGCTQTSNTILSQPPQLFATANVVSATCGSANGSASVSVSGGVGPYSYQWSPGNSTSSSISNLSGGSYSVIITDANGCTISNAVGISNTGGPTVSVLSTTHASCTGSSNGAASVNVSGTGPFSYQWNPVGGTSNTATNLSAGSYSVTVRDANNCVSSVALTITEPSPVLVVPAVTDIACNGQNTGAISVNASGGTGPYTYSWNNGSSASSISNLSAGSYSVTVTDARGCTGTDQMQITQPSALTSSMVTANVTCFNGNNGSADVNITGGTVPYAYSWSTGAGNTSAIAGLTAGNYTVTVTDANGCTLTVPVSIQQPARLLPNVTSAPVLCNGGSTGSVSTNITGGTAPFSFSWSPSASTTSSITNVAAGSYTVMVTDANGCTATASATITQPSPLSSSVIGPVNVSCFGGADGSARVNPSGGTQPYNYSWSPNVSANQQANNLSAGTYSITITDANGCSLSSVVSVNQPGPVTPAIVSVTNVSCNGGNNGSAIVDATGGTGNLTYNWSGSASSGTTANGLAAGNYSVTVTDDNGCTASISVTVNQPSPVAMTFNSAPSTCGYANGSATVNSIGGVGNYLYNWNNGSSDSSVTGLTAGTYSVIATDANGCTSQTSVTVSNIAGPTANVVANNNVSCFGGSDGSAAATISGGTGPFTYLWSVGNMATSGVSGLSAGNYAVTVTDANGCIASASISITQPPLLVSSVNNIVPILCNGGNNGSATALPSGGTGPYQYQWSPSGATTATASGLTAGNYIVTVTDDHGCTAQAAATLTEPSLMTAVTSSVPGTCNASNGTATVVPAGGTPPYTYLWQNSSTSSTANGLATGTYTVTVTDANNCSLTETVAVSNNGLFALNQNSVTPVSCNGGNNGSASVVVSGGLTPFTYTWSPAGGNSSTASGLPAGNYTVTVTDGYNCVQSVSITVTQPSLLTAAGAIQNHVRCFNGNDGSAQISPAGGTAPYSYSWNPGGYTTSSSNTLSNGNYSILITDANGCTTSASVTLSQPTPLAISSSSSPAGCGLTNGSATAVASGGVNPYTYQWNTGQSGATVTNVGAGAYTVTVTDRNNCTSQLSVGVSNFGGPSLALNSVTPVSCSGGNNGSASIVVSNGSSPFSYQWSPIGGNNASAASLPAGNYTVTVTDANNCVSAISLAVTEPSPLAASTSGIAALCNGSSDGSASVSTSGGTSPYTYTWSSGSINANANNLIAGQYSVIVTDANNCSVSSTVTITQPQAVTINISSDSVRCASGSDGALTALVSGGSGGYTYQWSNNVSGPAAASLSAGSYTVTVTDINGCTATSSAIVHEPTPVSLQTAATITRCAGSADGSASVSASGGNAPYQYIWSNGQTGINASGLLAGTYVVTVTDAYGCATTATALVPDNTPVVANATANDVRCFNESTGSATVIASGGTSPYTYLWNTNTVGSTASSLPAGNYTVIVTDANGCTGITAVVVTQPDPLLCFAASVPMVCIGQNITLNGNADGGTPPYNFTWSNGANTASQSLNVTSAQTFSVVVTDANGCVAGPASVPVTLFPALLVNATVPDTICRGDSLILNAIAAGGNGGPYRYEWSNGVIGNSMTVTPDSSMTFYVTANDQCGTPPATASVYVHVLPLPQLDLDNINAAGCAPLTVHFQPDGQLAGAMYNWTFGDGSSSTDPSPHHQYTQPGFYTIALTVETPDGCRARKSVAGGVKVYSLPEAIFSADPTSTNIYRPTITFTNTSVNAVQYLWDFGDGSGSSSLRDPIYTYSDTGTYLVQLISITDRGCPDTAYSVIKIDSEFAIFIPNAFTPNADEVNDTFKPLGSGISKAAMRIYDRWGLLIYQADEIQKGWDGRVSGNPCQADVYVYVIDVTDMRDEEHRYIGHVSLVR